MQRLTWWQRAIDWIVPPSNRFGWLERNLGGHLNLGPVVIFGQNAMHWAVNIYTRWGIVCFRLPLRCFGVWWPVYFYISRDGTPNSATFRLGRTY